MHQRERSSPQQKEGEGEGQQQTPDSGEDSVDNPYLSNCVVTVMAQSEHDEPPSAIRMLATSCRREARPMA